MNFGFFSVSFSWNFLTPWALKNRVKLAMKTPRYPGYEKISGIKKYRELKPGASLKEAFDYVSKLC